MQGKGGFFGKIVSSMQVKDSYFGNICNRVCKSRASSATILQVQYRTVILEIFFYQACKYSKGGYFGNKYFSSLEVL